MQNQKNENDKINQDNQKPPKPTGDLGYDRVDMDHYGRGEERNGDKQNKRYAESYSERKNENDRGEVRWNEEANISPVHGQENKTENYPHYGYDEAGIQTDIKSDRKEQ